MKTKLYSFTVIFLFLSFKTFAQQNIDYMSFAGPNGIFINMGMEIPFTESGKIHFKYKIERSNANENKWTEIVQISAPENYEAFLNQFYSLNKLLSDSIPSIELPLETIWQKAKEFERLDSMKYLGNPLTVRLALGVSYLDKQASEKTNYIYRISKLDKDGGTISSFVTNEISYPGKLENSRITVLSKEASENYIRINWIFTEGINPARFKVYRRTNFEGNFAEIYPPKIYNSNNNKLLFSILDSTVSSDNVYEYYALPLDYYQNPGYASDTAAIAAFSFNKLFPPYDINVTGADSLGGLELSWKLDNKNKIISLKIFRSKYFDKNFEEIGEVTGFDSVYIDRTAEPMTKYYYYLQLNDPFDEASLASAKVFGLFKSSEVPSPPFNLHSDSTSAGIKLVWNKPDEFVNVYHIYRNSGNDLNLSESFVLISADSIINFTDTSSSLKDNLVYYYSIRSENTSGNLSKYSDTIQVSPKITTFISSPKQLKGYALDGKVYLYWENLFEKNPTIEGFKIFRRKVDDKQKKEFTELFDTLLPPKQNNYVDTNAAPGNTYEYSVKAFNIFGNVSVLSSSISISIPSIPVLPPSGLTAVNSDNGISISWESPFQDNIKEFRIYRYERGNEPVQIGKVNFDKTKILDTSPVKGKLYFYYVVSISNGGEESIPSEELGIRR
jgi:fibronectin type 3 domain-containing protein